MVVKNKDKIAWLERTNPLYGLSIRDAQNIFDCARAGDTQRLHWLFQEIESANPVLLVCVERRASAIANFQWRISERAEADGVLSNEQRAAAQDFFGNIANFTDALEHLDLAFFRGFAHAQPIWEADGTVKEISLLDSWKFVRQGQEWFYNPACTGFAKEMQPTDKAHLMTVVRRRPIDYPALAIHVRHAVGSRDWGRFLERYALPKPAIFMHPGAKEEDQSVYLEGGQGVEDGKVAVFPNGASLMDFAGSSRGTDPFLPFIDHQEKQIVLLATGGTLMSLAESGTGTLAGNAQSDVWESITARDSSVIAQAVTQALLKPFLQMHFAGQRVAVDFGFDFTKPPTPKEVFETAAAAKAAGYLIAQNELEDATGFTLVKDEGAPLGGDPMPLLNKAENATPPGASPVLEAFAKDTTPLAEAIRTLLANPSPEKAQELLARLPELVPEDPALAAVIADAMAEEFGTGVENNKEDANGMEHADSGENGGQFVSKESRATDDEVRDFLKTCPKKITPSYADALLLTEFNTTDAAGHSVKFGHLLRDHLNDTKRPILDKNMRKSMLGSAVKLVSNNFPIKSSRSNREYEMIYRGNVDGKNFLAVADKHHEIGIIEMVSYRRNKEWNEENGGKV